VQIPKAQKDNQLIGVFFGFWDQNACGEIDLWRGKKKIGA